MTQNLPAEARPSSMTQDEHERLVRLEMLAQQSAKDMGRLAEQLDELSAQMRQLMTAAAMGKGAWWMAVKIGGAVLAIGGLFLAIYAALPKIH